MILSLFLIIASVFTGSTLSRIFARVLVFEKGVNLFPSGGVDDIRLFSEVFAKNKSYDIIEFILFVFFTLCAFGAYRLAYKKYKYSKNKTLLVGGIQIIIALIINI